MKIKLLRCEFTELYTKGVMIVDGRFFGFTLEDRVRTGPKVPKETAIASGIYQVVATMSPRFKRIMPLLLSVPSFEGIRIHGGNTHLDTEGCILIARNNLLGDLIQGSLEKELTAVIRAATNRGERVTIEIINSLDR